VLDVGTGSGTIAAEIARAAGPAGRVTSVDVADVRVERDGFAFLAYDGVRLPAADASADVVVSNHVIEHVGGRDAQRGHVREIARVLAPGGVAYVAAPHRWRLIENHYRLPLLSWLPARLADRYVRATGRADRYDCRLVTVRELRAMCRDAGLDARDATPDLVAASAALDGGAGGAALRLGVVRRLAAGPLAPSVAVVARRPPLSPG
jgi:SAM-dependent methyltransferase